MFEHVYISRATTLFTPEAIESLLRKSRENNEKLGVTGMLVYREPFFMQALEGPTETIETLLNRIARDPRHTEITTILNAPIHRRAFAGWSMGFFQCNPKSSLELVRQYSGYHDFFAADFEPRLFAANPSAAKKLLLAFRSECLRPQVIAPLAEARSG